MGTTDQQLMVGVFIVLVSFMVATVRLLSEMKSVLENISSNTVAHHIRVEGQLDKTCKLLTDIKDPQATIDRENWLRFATGRAED